MQRINMFIHSHSMGVAHAAIVVANVVFFAKMLK